MTAEEADILGAKLADPFWRMTSGELYKIAPADESGLQPFIPRPEQVEVIRAMLSHKRILIPKARRLGMSTVLGIFCADCLLFKSNWQGSLVDQTQFDASKKLDRIVLIALENLPDWLASRVTMPKSNNRQITVNVEGSGESSFTAGMDARGGSNNLLWVSEWGVIQQTDPKRSAKIRSGGLPSARHGTIVIETTWHGGRGGDVWDLMEPWLTKKANNWKVMFNPWWVDPRNVDEVTEITPEAERYFAKIADRLKEERITLTDAQRRWWSREKAEQGIWMARENPTFMDEMWTAPVDGAIYAESISRAHATRRVEPMPVDGSALVDTAWDLGAPKNTVVWYFQVVGREIRVIDCDRGDLGTLAQRAAHMKAKGYAFGRHFFPHDVETKERTGATMISEVAKHFPATSLVTVPRTSNVWLGINHLLELFPSLAFRQPHTASGLEALACYRTRREGEGAASVNEPVHDWASHVADALRTMAEAHLAGYLKFTHTAAQPRPDLYGLGRHSRTRVAPMRVSARG